MIDPIIQDVWETFSHVRSGEGEVQFSKSEWTDPHIVKMLNIVSAASGFTPEQIREHIAEDINKLVDRATISPTLYQQMADNAIESQVFMFMWKEATAIEVPGAPKFKEQTFFRLIRMLRGERSNFFPLSSWIDRRRLSADPDIAFNDLPPSDKGGVTTAAATPAGRFIFNRPFMQKLMDWAHVKEVRPKGPKWASNGGPIPDEYAYLEFLVMHEFMHYSEDDFYYQNILPNAQNTIINYAGDFRTNYFLVKNGFAQLPMGLFSDAVNLDRQRTYHDMYALVKAELAKFPKNNEKGDGKGEGGSGGGGGDGESGEGDGLGDQSDDHRPGQEGGGSEEAKRKSEGVTESDITKNQKKTQDSAGETDPNDPSKSSSGKSSPGGEPGKGRTGPVASDFANIRPTFSWRDIINKFVKSARPQIDTNWSKIARRSIVGLEVARARGAGAIKPADVATDVQHVKLALVLDTSGSMMGAVNKVMANVAALLKMPAYAKNNIVLILFSDGHDSFVVNVAKNRAGPFDSSAIGKNQQWTSTFSDVMGSYKSGGTDITSALPDLNALLADGYNVLICSDTDMLYDPNKSHMAALLSKYTNQIFWIMADANTYKAWRSQKGLTTNNISHM